MGSIREIKALEPAVVSSSRPSTNCLTKKNILTLGNHSMRKNGRGIHLLIQNYTIHLTSCPQQMMILLIPRPNYVFHLQFS